MSAWEELALFEDPAWVDAFDLGERVVNAMGREGVVVEKLEGKGGLDGWSLLVEFDAGHTTRYGSDLLLRKVDA